MKLTPHQTRQLKAYNSCLSDLGKRKITEKKAFKECLSCEELFFSIKDNAVYRRCPSCREEDNNYYEESASKPLY